MPPSTEYVCPVEKTDSSLASEVVDAVATVVESHTITGGTGRFAGATGSFTLERVVNVVTGVTAGSFDGTIVLHKKEHKAD